MLAALCRFLVLSRLKKALGSNVFLAQNSGIRSLVLPPATPVRSERLDVVLEVMHDATSGVL